MGKKKTDDKEEKFELPGMQSFGEETDSDILYRYPLDCSPLDCSYAGGIPAGRQLEIFAEESTGKSTYALEICKAFSQFWTARNQPHCVYWFEVENTFDQERCILMGYHPSKEEFYMGHLDTVEKMGDNIKKACEHSIKTGIKMLFVVDTIAALPTENELHPKVVKKEDGTVEENAFSGGMMEKPRVLKAELKKLCTPLAKSDGTLILCNQTMQKGQKTKFQAAEDPKAVGGMGPKYYSSVRSLLTTKSIAKSVLSNGEKEILHIMSSIKHVKSKVSPAKAEINMVIHGETGLDRFSTLLQFMDEKHMFKMESSWKCFEYPASPDKMVEVKFQNKAGLQEKIKENPVIKDWLDYQVYLHFIKDTRLLKVRLIQKIWHFEMSFYGKKVTELTEVEIEAANFEQQRLNQEF